MNTLTQNHTMRGIEDLILNNFPLEHITKSIARDDKIFIPRKWKVCKHSHFILFILIREKVIQSVQGKIVRHNH